MQIYLSNNYLENIDQLLSRSEKDKKIAPYKWLFFYKLENLLCSLPVLCDITEDEIFILKENIKKQNNLTLKYSLLLKIISSGNIFELLKSSISKVDNYSAYYFLDEKSLINDAQKQGVIAINSKKLFDYNLFDNYTYSNRKIIDNNYRLLRKYHIPANALLIRDKYLLKPVKQKIHNLSKFISYIIGDVKLKFHLTLIFSTILRDNTVEINEIDELISEFKNFNLLLEIIIDNELKSSDRICYTNYSTITIGHPFQDGITYISQNFLGYGSDSNEINIHYEDYKSDLKKLSSTVHKANQKDAVNYDCIYPMGFFRNRIFNIID
jgi:hypothetical protein